MPLFGKKKQQTDENAAPSVGTKTRTNLSQMFDESVPESVRSLLRENDAFKVGNNRYAILILDLDRYGFKNTKGKNTNQGEFIEYTKNSNISAFVPATGYLDGDNELGKEIIGIIPNSITIENLEEFELTREAEYTLAILDEDLNTQFTDVTINLEQVKEISEDDASITSFIPADMVNNASDDDDDADEDETIGSGDNDDDAESEIVEEEAYDDYEEGVIVDKDEDDDDYDDGIGDNMSGENYDDSGDDEYNEGYSDVEDTGDDFVDDVENMNYNGSDEEDEYDEDDQYEDDEPIIDRPLPGANPQEMSYTEEQLNKSYARKFYSEDLDIEVTTEPFDAVFANRKPFKRFDDNRDESDPDMGWLNRQLNQQSRDANMQLETLHAENLQEMRAHYTQTINRFCSDILAEVDPHNPDTTFYKQKQDLEAQKARLNENAQRQIEQLKADNERKFEADIQNARARAADEAEHSYRNKFTAQHEKELSEIDTKYRRDIEASYREAEQGIHNERREYAKRKFDTAVTNTLVQVEKEYNLALQGENELYQQFAAQLENTYESYRVDSIARAKALADEIKQNDLVAKTKEDCALTINNIQQEYNIKAENMEDEKNKAIATANERVSYMEQQCKERLEDERSRCTALQERIDDMSHDVKIESERKDREYQARINELKQENKIWVDKYDILDATTKRQHLLSTVLVVAIAIIMIAVGFIIGMYSGLNKASENQAAATRIVTEVNDSNN